LTWANGQVIGSASDSTFFLGGQAVVTDIYNFDNQKQLNQYVRPFSSVISFTYQTPGFFAESRTMKILSSVVKDWQVGAVLRYQSGQLIGNPTSLNQLTAQLARSPTGSNFGLGATNYWNVTGEPQLLVDPNCKCFNPQTDKILNNAAWTDAPSGQWTTSAPFYNNFRWQRQPSEAMNFGRNFRFGSDGRYVLFVRAEFQNIFNRTFLGLPSTGNPNVAIGTVPYAGVVINNSGFGSITTINGAGSQPRSGQMVARFSF
jgi:hypothetical protein